MDHSLCGPAHRHIKAHSTQSKDFPFQTYCWYLLKDKRSAGVYISVPMKEGGSSLTSATGTPSGGRQCSTIIPLIGTSFPWGSCSKFFLRSARGDKRQLSGVKCYDQPSLHPRWQPTRATSSSSKAPQAVQDTGSRGPVLRNLLQRWFEGCNRSRPKSALGLQRSSWAFMCVQ